MTSLANNDLQIVIKNFDQIDREHLHSMWFGGKIVEITYKGYKFHIGAYGIVEADLWRNGEIIASSKDKSNLGAFYSNMTPEIKNDLQLVDYMTRDSMCDTFLDVIFSNSFELSMFKGDNEIDLGDGAVLDSSMLFEAIDEVVCAIPDLINWDKEGAA